MTFKAKGCFGDLWIKFEILTFFIIFQVIFTL